MGDDMIRYKSGYKYQLVADYTGTLSPELEYQGEYENDFICVRGREITLRKGYASDGPSGPTIDTKNFMRGAFRHDSGYQLIQLGIYPQSSKDAWDRQLQADCIEDGMWKIRAWWVYQGVRFGGGKWAKKGAGKPVLTA